MFFSYVAMDVGNSIIPNLCMFVYIYITSGCRLQNMTTRTEKVCRRKSVRKYIHNLTI